MVIEINRRPDRPRVDPRERQDWFLRLDEDARDVVRAGWIEEQLHQERLEGYARKSWQRDWVYGAGLMATAHAIVVYLLVFVLESFAGGASYGQALLHVLFAGLVGAGLGSFWKAVDAGVMICALSGFFAVFAFEVAGGIGPFFGLFGGFLGGLMGGYVGLRRTELPGM